MRELRENEKQTIDYLLGAMNEARRDEFEERLFLDEDLSFAVEAAEKDLIDEYLRGELDFEEKRKFESNFLITDSRRDKLRVAEVLNRKLFAEKETAAVSEKSLWEKLRSLFAVPNLALAGGAAAIILFLILGGIWLSRRDNNQQIASGNNQNSIIEKRETPPPTVQPMAENPNNSNANAQINRANNLSNKVTNSNEKPAPNANRQKETKPENPPPAKKENSESSGGAILAFTLFPATRSGENQRLTIAPETETISLRVLHNNEDAFVRYRAELRNSDGETVWSREIPARSKSKSLDFTLDSKLFKADLYELALLGVTPAGEYEETNFYNFTVRKK